MADLCSIFNKITGCETREDIIPSKDPKARYSRITIPLNVAFTDKEYHLAGSFIGVVSVTGGGSCTIRLDYLHSGQINLREIETIKSKFNKLYITTDGNGGVLTLYICQSMETIISPETKTAYTGMVLSMAGETGNDVLRLIDSSYGFHLTEVTIRNANFTRDAEIGWIPFTGGLPNRADFLTWSFRLIPKMQTTLVEVDAAGIGYCSTVVGAPANLKIIGSIA